ncbi:hypothetical protein ACLKA7_005688 [Drosophila subpalustris]
MAPLCDAALGPASTSSVANSPSSTTARCATSLAAHGLQYGVVLLATAVVMRLSSQVSETQTFPLTDQL